MNLPAARVTGAADAIDFSRGFMPEGLTPLYYTSVYSGLTARQQLRYNQLNALYFNEQIMFFEQALARNVLSYFLTASMPGGLKEGLRQFMAEEERHTAMFRRLNRQCAPELYADGDFHFIRLPAAAARLLDFASRRPQWFPLFLWLMHLQEERALFFGRAFVKCGDRLEPHFLGVQRAHLADEVGHVHWDQALLDWIWPGTQPWLRRCNAQFLGWLVKEYFSAPKRSGLRVVAAWMEEFPELRPHYPELRRQLLRVTEDGAFRRSFLYSPETVPATFKRFDAWPEFSVLARFLPGYAAAKV